MMLISGVGSSWLHKWYAASWQATNAFAKHFGEACTNCSVVLEGFGHRRTRFPN
jgi:hypothetical protein